jgi:hypothetical protein
MIWNPKIKKMNWFVQLLTLGWASAMTLAPFGIYIKEKYFPPYRGFDRMVNHERIHWCQEMELFIVGIFVTIITGTIFLIYNLSLWWYILIIIIPFAFYYAWYFIEWIIKTILPPWKSEYKHLGFEREAYLYDDDLDYLLTRKHFIWLKYMFHDNIKYLKTIFNEGINRV